MSDESWTGRQVGMISRPQFLYCQKGALRNNDEKRQRQTVEDTEKQRDSGVQRDAELSQALHTWSPGCLEG